MSGVPFGAKSKADRRYYHAVLMRVGQTVSLAKMWACLGESVVPDDGKSAGGLLQRRKLFSSEPYVRGDVLRQMSQKGKGRAPYLYDVFGGKVSVNGEEHVLLCFPAVALARLCVSNLLASKAVSVLGFQRVDLKGLVKESESERVSDPDGDLNVSMVGVQFVITNDKSLVAVRLGGDQPLRADIYTTFLRPQKAIRPDLCVLSLEMSGDARDPNAKAVRSRLRVDGFGNFKFYVHTDFANLMLLPVAVNRLQSIGCLEKAVGRSNPLLRLQQEEE